MDTTANSELPRADMTALGFDPEGVLWVAVGEDDEGIYSPTLSLFDGARWTVRPRYRPATAFAAG